MAPRQTLVERNHISALGVIAPPPIHVSTPTFDGSLAMLFQCVRDHKVQLLDVPLYPICEAYFLYLVNLEDTCLDEAAAALAALAYLLERKAWLLLPVEEPEPEMMEPMELPTPTAHEYELAIESLRVWHEERSQIFFRSPDAGPEPYELPLDLNNISSGDLAKALERLLRRARPEDVRPLGKPRKSLSDQMRIVLHALTDEWRSLEDMVADPFTRSEAVYWFLALLELIRLGQAAVRVEGEDVVFSRAQRKSEKAQPGLEIAGPA
jgi:segregation and condensation protein A